MIFAGDLHAPEGPVALPDGTWLIVEGGADRGCVTCLSRDGRTRSIIKRLDGPMAWPLIVMGRFGSPSQRSLHS